MSSFLETALKAGQAASEHILKSLDTNFEIKTKSNPRDLVTQVDIETEAIIRKIISEQHPEHNILGEEEGEGKTNAQNSEYRWVIDPIDGTSNFARRFPHYCVSIALEHKEKGVHGVIVNPSMHDTYTSTELGTFKNNKAVTVSDCQELIKGYLTMSFGGKPETLAESSRIWLALLEKSQVIRRIGSTALELAYVAEGKTDAFLGLGQSIWDYAAGIHLVKQAGGIVELRDNGKTVLAASSLALLNEMKAVLD